MKKILILSYFTLFFGCSSVDEIPSYTCNNVVLEKPDWTYCYIRFNRSPIKCFDKNDTLEFKKLEYVENIQGIVIADSMGCVDILDNITGKKKGTLAVYNLPDCFQKKDLKIRFSGDKRIYPGLNETCGEPFELTKIEIVE